MGKISKHINGAVVVVTKPDRSLSSLHTINNLSLLSFTKQGIYCAQGNFYVDPWLPVDYAVITHGHADHARWGSKHYLCQTFTKPILQLRLGADISVDAIEYGKTIFINGVQVSLHPAGHIIGSAQIRIEYGGQVAVVSGDYKVANDGLSTAFEPVKCHEFVTESTFGLPIYKWKTDEQIFAEIKEWVTGNIAQGKASVFIAYSLGKAQRIMQGLQGVAPMYVHRAVQNLNDAIATTGIQLPPTTVLTHETEKSLIENSIVIAPPALEGTKWIKRIPRGAIAICSGWMQVRGSRRWQSADAGFAVSDHADWDGLLSAIKATEAEKVYVTHGSTATFSKYLNEQGMAAEEVQTEFGKEDDEVAVEDAEKTEKD